MTEGDMNNVQCAAELCGGLGAAGKLVKSRDDLSLMAQSLGFNDASVAHRKEALAKAMAMSANSDYRGVPRHCLISEEWNGIASSLQDHVEKEAVSSAMATLEACFQALNAESATLEDRRQFDVALDVALETLALDECPPRRLLPLSTQSWRACCSL